jgi:hypothetical protein
MLNGDRKFPDSLLVYGAAMYLVANRIIGMQQSTSIVPSTPLQPHKVLSHRLLRRPLPQPGWIPTYFASASRQPSSSWASGMVQRMGKTRRGGRSSGALSGQPRGTLSRPATSADPDGDRSGVGRYPRAHKLGGMHELIAAGNAQAEDPAECRKCYGKP